MSAIWTTHLVLSFSVVYCSSRVDCLMMCGWMGWCFLHLWLLKGIKLHSHRHRSKPSALECITGWLWY